MAHDPDVDVEDLHCNVVDFVTSTFIVPKRFVLFESFGLKLCDSNMIRAVRVFAPAVQKFVPLVAALPRLHSF